MKSVLITGSNGFVGRNLTVSLAQRKDLKVTGFDVDDDPATLPSLVAGADFIFHLAGVNRPQNVEEFTTGNIGLTQTIVSLLQKQGKSTPLLISSSTQAAQENPYGLRPLLMEYLPLYSPEQARRHKVRPGITGWAQVNGRNAISWEEKFKLDVWYVDNQSLWLDLKILWMTMKKVFIREGISQEGQATMEKFKGSI